ncbi:hypothetical protein PR048_014440 [Dryococelus australis]|uniref:LIM zinc-binding domain-containing protein n=1 Tax=Dryococelus australis TaxID=614101 RepID=A0ABQ9HE91_9NEOP|nr:hypothetical protein PR048_014440 [Dryococelus australis]
MRTDQINYCKQQVSPLCSKEFKKTPGLASCARRIFKMKLYCVKNVCDMYTQKKRRLSLCVGCGAQIHDQYILRVAPDLEWHAACLKCAECHQFLDETCTCFVRDGKTYCKRDYVRYAPLEAVHVEGTFWNTTHLAVENLPFANLSHKKSRFVSKLSRINVSDVEQCGWSQGCSSHPFSRRESEPTTPPGHKYTTLSRTLPPATLTQPPPDSCSDETHAAHIRVYLSLSAAPSSSSLENGQNIYTRRRERRTSLHLESFCELHLGSSHISVCTIRVHCTTEAVSQFAERVLLTSQRVPSADPTWRRVPPTKAPARLPPRRTGFNPRPDPWIFVSGSRRAAGFTRGSPVSTSCRMMPLVGGFSRVFPVSPAPSFWRFSILTSITLIGFQDLVVKGANLPGARNVLQCVEKSVFCFDKNYSTCAQCANLRKENKLQAMTECRFHDTTHLRTTISKPSDIAKKKTFSDCCMSKCAERIYVKHRYNPALNFALDFPSCYAHSGDEALDASASVSLSVRSILCHVASVPILFTGCQGGVYQATRLAQGKQDSILGGPLPAFSMWKPCRTMPLVDGFSWGPSRFPAHAFRRSSILIGSQDLDVKSRPNLSTPLFYLQNYNYTYAAINFSFPGRNVASADPKTRVRAELPRDLHGTSASRRVILRYEVLWVRVTDYSSPTTANRVHPRSGHTLIFTCGNRVEKYRWSAGFLRNLPFPPPFHSGAAPYSPHFTFLGSQGLYVKSCPNLFTHSCTQRIVESSLMNPREFRVSSYHEIVTRVLKVLILYRGATVGERLARSPPTKAKRVQSPAGRWRCSAGFLGDHPFPPSLHSGAAPYSLQSPSSALKSRPNLFTHFTVNNIQATRCEGTRRLCACVRRLFGTKCDKCGLSFSKNDFVMRAKTKIYHIECFRCSACERQLIPGDEFALREDGLFCKEDHEVLEKATNSENNNNTTNVNNNTSHNNNNEGSNSGESPRLAFGLKTAHFTVNSLYSSVLLLAAEHALQCDTTGKVLDNTNGVEHVLWNTRRRSDYAPVRHELIEETCPMAVGSGACALKSSRIDRKAVRCWNTEIGCAQPARSVVPHLQSYGTRCRKWRPRGPREQIYNTSIDVNGMEQYQHKKSLYQACAGIGQGTYTRKIFKIYAGWNVLRGTRCTCTNRITRIKTRGTGEGQGRPMRVKRGEDGAAPECKNGGENSATNGIVRHDSHMRKFGSGNSGKGTRVAKFSYDFTASLDRRMDKVIRPSPVLILHKEEEHTTCIQVGLKHCSFYRERCMDAGARYLLQPVDAAASDKGMFTKRAVMPIRARVAPDLGYRVSLRHQKNALDD